MYISKVTKVCFQMGKNIGLQLNKSLMKALKKESQLGQRRQILGFLR